MAPLLRIPRPALLTLIGAALLLAGCSGEDPGPSPDDGDATRLTVSGPLVVASTLAPGPAEALWKELRSQVRRLDLTVETVTDDALSQRLAAGGIDLVLSARTAPIERLAAEGLLAPLPERITLGVPDARLGVGHRWLAIGLRARVIAVRRMMANKPRYVTDLSEARFRGRAARSPLTAEPAVTTVATLMADRAARFPPAFLAGLTANCGDRVLDDEPATVAALAERKADLALVDHTIFFGHVIGDAAGGPLAGRAVAESSLEAIFPDADGTGAAWSATGAGVATGAGNPDGALALLEVLLSDPVQAAWSMASLEYPATEGVPAAPGLPPADGVTWSRTSLAELAAHRAGALAHVDHLLHPPSDDDDSGAGMAVEPATTPEDKVK